MTYELKLLLYVGLGFVSFMIITRLYAKYVIINFEKKMNNKTDNNDNVCVWQELPNLDGGDPHIITDCKNKSSLDPRWYNYTFCPFCSKRIKLIRNFP
jgi:hypothetical protein